MLEQIPGEKHVTVGGDKVDTRDFVIFGVSSTRITVVKEQDRYDFTTTWKTWAACKSV
jgi:hypothetical protein